jgi:hypothetical protein
MTHGTGPIRTVKREGSRLKLGKADIAVGAKEVQGIETLFAIPGDHQQVPSAHLERFLHGLSQPLLGRGGYSYFIYQDFDVVFFGSF